MRRMCSQVPCSIYGQSLFVGWPCADGCEQSPCGVWEFCLCPIVFAPSQVLPHPGERNVECPRSDHSRALQRLSDPRQCQQQHRCSGNHHPVIQQLKPRLLEGEAIVSAITLETRITSFMRAFLHAAKERLKCKVNSFLHILQNLRMYLLEFRVFTLPRSQHFICVIQGYGSLLTLPRILADCKCSVIHQPA